ncbi:hypothetical protein GCM10010169_21360 [Micromonospora fulviviridis]|nr:hypothetical protein GCM10010169_21360 [Micromonospora fulviviridis]
MGATERVPAGRAGTAAGRRRRAAAGTAVVTAVADSSRARYMRPTIGDPTGFANDFAHPPPCRPARLPGQPFGRSPPSIGTGRRAARTNGMSGHRQARSEDPPTAVFER